MSPLIYILGAGIAGIWLLSRGGGGSPKINIPDNPPIPRDDTKPKDDGHTTMPAPVDMAVATQQGADAGDAQGQTDGGNCGAAYNPDCNRTPPGFVGPPSNPDARSNYCTAYTLHYNGKFNDARAAAGCG